MGIILREERNKGGRPSLEQTENVKGRILEIISRNIVCYPAQVCKIYGDEYRRGKPLSWSVLRGYIEQLKAEQRIVVTVLHKGKKHTTIQIKVSEKDS